MNRATRPLLLIIAGLITTGALAAVILFVVIDPGRYRPAIEQSVEETTGLELQIAGEIDWTFRPVFGLTLNGVRLYNPATRQELASVPELSLRLSPARLVRGELAMEELIARDLHLDWSIDADGESNWRTDIPDTPTDSDGPPISLDIRRIAVSNASLAFRNEQRGIEGRLENLDINSRNPRLDDQPFPLEITTRIPGHTSDRDLDIRLQSHTQIDFNGGNVLLEDLRMQLDPMVLEGHLAIRDFRNTARWESELQSNTFNPLHLLEAITGHEAGPSPDSNRLALHTRLNGDHRGATISSLEISLDDLRASLTGDVLYPQAERPLILAYRFDADRLDLDRWLSPPETGTNGERGGPDTVTGDTETTAGRLPFGFLESLELRGSHHIAALHLSGLRFTDLDAELTVEDGLLDLQLQPAGFHEGELAARLQVDSAATPPRIDSRVTAENVNVARLAERSPLLPRLAGRMSLEAGHSLAGRTVDGLLDTISGLTRVSLSEGSADITLIRHVFDAISVLSPDGNMTRGWPEQAGFEEMEVQWRLNGGLDTGQEVAIRMDNLDLEGNGGLRLDEQRFDYDFDVTILGEPARQTIRINPEYRDISWPVRCDAAFSARPSRYCSPDLQQVRELFTRMTRDEGERPGQ